MDRNSKISTAGNRERRLGCAQIRDYVFVILKVKEPFLTSKFPAGQKKSDAKSTHRPLLESTLAERFACTHCGVKENSGGSPRQQGDKTNQS